MKGLALKDFLVLKKYCRNLLFVCVFYIIWGYFMDNMSIIGGMMTLVFSMMVITSFAYDDAAKWEAYALTLPVSRRDLINGKYLLSLCLILAGALFSFAMTAVIVFIKHDPLSFDLILSCLIIVAISVLFQSFSIPMIVKLGAEKARIAMLPIFILPSLLIFGIIKLNPTMPSEEILHFLEVFLPWLIGCVILLLYVISYFVSVRFIEKKEF